MQMKIFKEKMKKMKRMVKVVRDINRIFWFVGIDKAVIKKMEICQINYRRILKHLRKNFISRWVQNSKLVQSMGRNLWTLEKHFKILMGIQIKH